MNLKDYYADLHKVADKLGRDYPDGIVYVTSLFHRERNSTAGTTISGSVRNAARVITDGTHREATKIEIDSFLAYQQQELRRNTVSEQRNKKQYIVVVDDREKIPAIAGGGEED